MGNAIVPTARAALLLAMAAGLALVLGAVAPGAWLAVPLLGVGVLALVVADALAAGRLVEVRVIAPVEIAVGAEATITVLADLAGRRGGAVAAALQLDPRLAPGGALALDLARDPASDSWSGKAQIIPTRRGIATIDTLWLRWTGPLGLGARQHRRAIGAGVRVLPNITALHSPAFQTFLRDSPSGEIARRLRGEGSVFDALREYRPGTDRRRIDWKSSARHATLLAREYQTERNNPIVFAFDCGAAMCEPVAGEGETPQPRIDRAVSAALATAYVALKGGDRVALFGFAARVVMATPFVSGAREFHRLQSAAAALDYRAEEPNFTLALASLASRLQRRALIVVFSDFTDPTGAELMIESIARLVARHRLLFVSLRDEELAGIAAAPPASIDAIAMAVTAAALQRQRALVLARLRQIGVMVVEAPHNEIGPRLIDAYLAIKRGGGID